uniref:eCIS core domain-containing protein n=1 Tax=Cupriavidus yeoncheonensis TaxID=1462994 RepID=UPI003F4917E5
MPTAPPSADTRKPASPSPSKDAKDARQGGARPGAGPAAEIRQGQPPGKGEAQEKTPAGNRSNAPKEAQSSPGTPQQAAGGKEAGDGGQQRFDQMAVRAKLAVSEPGDAVEREADTVADKVMRMAEPLPDSPGSRDRQVTPPTRGGKPEALRRKEEPDKARTPAIPATGPGSAARNAPSGKAGAPPPEAGIRQEMPKSAGGPGSGHAAGKPGDEIQRKEDSKGTSGTATESGHSAANQPGTTQELMERLGSGEPLDADTRAYFEKRLCFDLGHVRIHTDTAAALNAKQLNARAFTFGPHIAFASGAYDPQSAAGKHLLAHELAHVMQQEEGSVARKIMRQPAGGSTASGSEFDVTHAELEVPPIKSRHLGGYTALAGNNLLRRKGAYDASTRGTKQVSLWTGGVKADVGKIPEAQRPSTAAGINLNLNVKGGASAKVIKAGSLEELRRLLQIPTWDGAGNDVQFQVDHMVEYQLGGADALDNMELLNQAHNGSVGSSFSHGIKRTVREEIQQDPGKAALTGYAGPRNTANDPTAEGVMDSMTVVFHKVKGRARESGKKEGGSVFWTREQIEALDHVLPLLGAGGEFEGNATSFALLSPTGNLLIARLEHGNGQNTITVAGNQAGGMAGFKMKRVVLNAQYNDAAAGASIGTLEGQLNFGPSVTIPPGDVSVGISQQSPGKYSGRVGSAVGTGLPNQVEFKPMSPLQISDITFGKSVFGKASLQPTHPALNGISIPAQIVDGKLGLFYTLDATSLAGRLKIPGVKIDSAGITFGYDGTDFSVGGGAEFTIQKFGTGFLNASTDSAGDFALEGGLRADKRLFDQADMRLWYRKKGGFGGTGTLAITQPGKIKGIKSARLTARYEDSVFSAEGTVMPDIPGLKAASLSVSYGNEQLEITGKLGIDDKVPGVQKADITVKVTQANDAWKVAASGDVTPKLPALSGAQLKFSYDDGFVLIEGEFSIDKGPISGKLKAGVTNGTVDDKGVRSESGSGDKFSVFGAAEVDAVFIKDKLAGKLKLRLLPEGTIRVGGDLTVADFDVFPQIPKDGGEFLNKEINSPRIPLPGAGFSVGQMSIGVTFWASGHIKAHASVGPGRMTGITLTIAEFDPANVDLNTLEIGGKAKFVVDSDAGLEVGADINVGLSAAVVDLVGSLGVSGEVGIPKQTPVLTASTNFTYSKAKGLDIGANCNLDISPGLSFKLKGGFSARLNLYVDTVTLWHKDWTLAEANYKLPIGITANGALHYNSKQDKLDIDPSSAIKVKTPEFSADDFKRILDGSPAPIKVENIDKDGKPTGAQPTVNPKREDGAAPSPSPPVDEGIVARLGTGIPLDLATRGYFEQRMQVDLNRVLIHTGPTAAREAKQLSARAFTVGDHIAFAEGEFRPDTPEGQELIAHELAHIAQLQGAGQPIVLRWPAVTRTSARTGETPATIRGMSLADFSTLTQSQLDWATSPALQADAAALGQFRDLQTFAEGPGILQACGGLNMAGIIGKGIPAVYPDLRKYTEGVTSHTTAWLRRTGNIDEAQRWGAELTTLEAAWPAANLSLVMRRPDPVSSPSPFEKLENPAAPELATFISYLSTCSPVLSAENGREVDSFLALRREGGTPTSYAATISHVRNYHHFTKPTLDGLATNEAVPQWQQQLSWTQRPLTLVLYPAVDHNGAFHRNAGLQTMVTDSSILTIVIEGHASVADYQSQLAPVAARYGANGEIQQAMVGGHGNSTILQLAGAMSGAGTTIDSLGTTGAGGTSTTHLVNELTRLMSTDPRRRRIVLDACLTNSHHVASALRASPSDAAADVSAAIAANPSLRDFVAGMAGAGASVSGANASFAPSQTTFMTPGSRDIGLSVPGDPDLIAGKLSYVEFGTEPEGCMRALLESWAADQRAGTHDTRDAVLRRIAAGASAHVAAPHRSSWRESIIQPLYYLAVNHYWGNGDALRQMSSLAGALFELFWPGHTTASSLSAKLAVLAGNPAHVDRLLGSVAGDPHYAATPRVAIVIEQAWMRHTPARRANFLTALGRYASCLEASADVEIGAVMAHVPALLTVPPPSPPPADQLRLALLAAHHAPVGVPPPSPLPTHAGFLRGLLGGNPTFPAGLGIDTALGGYATEPDILADIGRPLAAAPAGDPLAPPPDANLNLTRTDAPDLNDFRVTPLRRNGQVATARDDLMVRGRPTTGVAAFDRLPTGTVVAVIGEYGDWYAIERTGRTGFVSKRFITLL